MEDTGCIRLKLVSPAMQHRAGDPKLFTHFFLRRVTPHAFQDHFEFELWRITLPFGVHLIQYLSLLLCLVYQVLDKRSVLQFLYESGLINKDDKGNSIIDLGEADLFGANLTEAELNVANLGEASLQDTNLSRADLRDADLRDAYNITTEELEKQTKLLEGASMPDGYRHE